MKGGSQSPLNILTFSSFCSTAKRAKDTIEIITKGESKIQYKSDLYTFDHKELIAFIKKEAKSFKKAAAKLRCR